MPSTPIASGPRPEVDLTEGFPGRIPASDDRAPTPLELFGFEASLTTTSLDRLEAIAQTFSPRWLTERFERFDGTVEAALLGTCCRRELVLLSHTAEEVEQWRSALLDGSEGWTQRTGRELVHHLFRVAGGRESLAVGEQEVRSQVRFAAHSTLSRHRRRLLRDLFEEAADAADRAEPTVPRSRSIAALAATRVLELTGRPFPRVLVVGAGVVGRQVTELLAPSARVTLLYRHQPPDEEFLRASGARAAKAADLAAEVALSDAVVTAARNEDRCLRASDFPTDRPVVVVDLGVPRNVDPATRHVPSVRLVDLTDLRPRSRPGDHPAADRSLAESADRFYDRFERVALEPWIAAARRRAETIRASELSVARPFLGPLTEAQEVAVERLTQRLVARLLAGPTERLRAIPSGEEGDRLRRFALELLRPDPPVP